MKKINFQWLKKTVVGYPIIAFLVVAILFAVIFVPHFTSSNNLINLCLQVCDLLVIACGLTFILLNASIDFSCTSVLAVSSVVGAYIMALSPLSQYPALAIVVAVIVMIAIGALFGVINGIAVIRLKMPSFIATLATQLIGSAFAVWFTSQFNDRAASIGGLPPAFFIIGGKGDWFIVPVLISIAMLILANWMMRKTKFGRNVYAVGTNPKTALISGIPVKKTIFMMFLISGIFAGVEGVLLTARNQAGISGLGSTMFINIVAAVVIGGTSILGGFGGMIQTLLGVCFIVIINNAMNLIGVEWYTILLVQGILILIATFIDYLIKHPRETRGHSLKKA
jgi:ribose/xylose/arabinose/galactoside ABC-type transport system permease subunit